LYYAPIVFQNVGLESAAAALSTVGVGAVKLVATITAVFLVDHYGRRALLMLGAFGMFIALLILGSAALGDMTGFDAWLTLGAMMTYVSAYEIGFGPLTWLIVSEVFPLRVRSQAFSIAMVANFAANFLVSATYLSAMQLITEAGLYWTFAAITLTAIAFIYVVVPETKKRTLEQIEEMMNQIDIRERIPHVMLHWCGCAPSDDDVQQHRTNDDTEHSAKASAPW
jgi:MFS family permease